MSVLKSLFEWFTHLSPHDDDCMTVTVRKGESLWAIAEDLTGNGERWDELADANADKGWDKDHTLQVGETLKIPHDWANY